MKDIRKPLYFDTQITFDNYILTLKSSFFGPGTSYGVQP